MFTSTQEIKKKRREEQNKKRRRQQGKTGSEWIIHGTGRRTEKSKSQQQDNHIPPPLR
jgi:hypothetical protein